MSRPSRRLRDQRVVVKFDADTIKEVNATADKLYEGNRSLMIRDAVVTLIDRRRQDVVSISVAKEEDTAA